MLFRNALMLLTAALILNGCAEERIPSEDSDAWEVSKVTVDNVDADLKDNDQLTSPPAAPGTAEPTQPAKDTLPDGVVAILKGSAFGIDGTTSTKEIKGDEFVALHYLSASALVDLKTSVSMIETEIEGENKNGAVPMVGFQVEKKTGKYQSYGRQERPIDGKQNLNDTYDLAPAKYNIKFTYYKDSVGEKRPKLVLKRIVFHK